MMSSKEKNSNDGRGYRLANGIVVFIEDSTIIETVLKDGLIQRRQVDE